MDNNQILEKKQMCAIFGRPICHSLSPLIHNHLFEEYKMPYYYKAFEIFDLCAAVKLVRTQNMRGVSITIPFKVEVMQYLDELTELARQIGAVNTIINDNGKLTGDNTDAYGVINSFRTRNIDLTKKNIVLLGCGGAARAVAFGLLATFKINKLTVAGLAKELAAFTNEIKNKTGFSNIETFELDNARYSVKCDDYVIANATSAGMEPAINNSLIDNENSDYTDKIFFDVIYNPLKTRMLQDAENSGARIITGIDMFIFQALRQHYLWTGNNAEYNDISKLILDSLSH